MNNTAKFLACISSKAANLILDNIAAHYGISRQDAMDEVTGEDAEHLLDYVTGPERAATSVLMQKYGFAA